ncbi:MAG: class I SAM-dependent methyltransferase [Thiolinea sp.]
MNALDALDAARKMDQQYRYQRHIYDLSRKYYLLGRERILREIPLLPGQHLLEVGCGTGSNLYKLAYRFPEARLYGLDASEMMLASARAHRRYPRHGRHLHFSQGLAQQVTPDQFGLEQGFDHVLLSYVLSMIPDWCTAIEQAINSLRPGGCLHIVDFSDQASMPVWFRKLLLQWLDWFHVHPDPEVPAYLQELEARLGGELQVAQVMSRYALIIHYRKQRRSDDAQPETLQIPKYLDF